MPWKETSVLDERMKFIGRLLSGEKMAPLCREFGISRTTGHKVWKRYQESGSTAVQNRSRAPHSHPNQTPFEVEQVIVRLLQTPQLFSVQFSQRYEVGMVALRSIVGKRPGKRLPCTPFVMKRHFRVDVPCDEDPVIEILG
jgi:hypothetical protein